MSNKIKRVFSSFMAICMVMSMFVYYNQGEIKAESTQIQPSLLGIEITADVNSSWSDANTDIDAICTNIESEYDTYTSDKPLELSNTNELAAFAKVVNSGKSFEGKYIKLMNDIDLKGTAPIVKEKTTESGYKHVISGTLENVWVPIGRTKKTPFKGNFDGNNKKIENMVVLEKDDSSTYAGLFGYMIDGMITSVGVIGDSFSCSSSSSSFSAGGLVGSSSGKISNCYATVNVYSCSSYSSDDNYSSSAGGLVGFSVGAISECYATGNVYSFATASDYAYSSAGGLVGSSSSTISTCYATGNVYSFSATSDYGNSCAGGLVGSSSSTISECYAMGNVYSDTSYANTDSSAGGLVGYQSSGNVENSYSYGDATIIDEGKRVDRTNDTTALTPKKMTGFGDGRANKMMVGFTENNWIFSEDNTTNTPLKMIAYFPRIKTLVNSYTEKTIPQVVLLIYPKLLSIEQPATIELASGASLDDIKDRLPEKVKITIDPDPNKNVDDEATISWVDGNNNLRIQGINGDEFTYNPNNKEKQSFKILGTIKLPKVDGFQVENPDSISTNVEVIVTVSAEEDNIKAFVPTGDDSIHLIAIYMLSVALCIGILLMIRKNVLKQKNS